MELATFTFHYASTLSGPVDAEYMAYAAFTFHYASTLSFSRGQRQFYYSLFTFHYASTLSCAVACYFHSLPNLHSTMLLLYPVVPEAESGNIQNLHSTMLLLYRLYSSIHRA